MNSHLTHLQCISSCIHENRIWFSNISFNGIFSINWSNGEVTFESYLPWNKRDALFLSCQCGKYQNSVFFFPNSTNCIFVYDFVSQSIRKIEFEPKDGADVFVTGKIFRYRDTFWIIPTSLKQGVWKLDCRKWLIERDVELENVLSGIHGIKFSLYKSNVNHPYILTDRNELVMIDFFKKGMDVLTKFDYSLQIHTMVFSGKRFWLLFLNDTDILEYIPLNNTLTRYSMTASAKWINGKGIPYNDLVVIDNMVFISNFRLRDVMMIDLNDSKKNIVPAFSYPENFRIVQNIFWQSNAVFSSISIFPESKQLIFHPILANGILVYNYKEGTVELYEIAVPVDEFPFLKRLKKENGEYFFRENMKEISDLELFLDYITNVGKVVCNPVRTASLGKKIYANIVSGIQK